MTAFASSSHEEDWNFGFLGVSAAAETIKQDGQQTTDNRQQTTDTFREATGF